VRFQFSPLARYLERALQVRVSSFVECCVWLSSGTETRMESTQLCVDALQGFEHEREIRASLRTPIDAAKWAHGNTSPEVAASFNGWPTFGAK
jgi:hypothetical protein